MPKGFQIERVTLGCCGGQGNTSSESVIRLHTPNQSNSHIARTIMLTDY